VGCPFPRTQPSRDQAASRLKVSLLVELNTVNFFNVLVMGWQLLSLVPFKMTPIAYLPSPNPYPASLEVRLDDCSYHR
jgi:hypothetical protein